MIASLLPESVSAVSALLLVVASFFTAGLTAAAGIGGGLLMLALMTYLIPIHALIPVHGLVQLGSNTGRTWVQRENVDWNTTRLFLFGSLVGALGGALLTLQLPKQALEMFLGIFILVLVWVKLPAIRNINAPLIAIGGMITTFISMFAGATGPLVAVFLNKLFDSHRTIVATHGATMTVQHGLKILAFGLVGFAFTQWLGLIAAMVISGYFGTVAGTKLMNRLPENTLKTAFKFTLTLVALDLLRRGLNLF